MRRSNGWYVGVVLFLALLARAENAVTPGEVGAPYPTVIHLAVEWKVQGDDNLNAVCSVRFRPSGDNGWRDGLPLRRVPAGKSQGTTPIFTWENKLSGSLFDLKPDTEYEIELKLSDPDGGGAEKTLRARTRPAPRIPAGAEVHDLPAGNYQTLEVQNGTPERPMVYLSKDGSAVYKDVNLRGKKWVYLEGVSVKNPDAKGRGIIMNGAEHCVVRRCKINAVYGVVAYKPGATNCYIADNVIEGVTKWAAEALGAGGKNIGEGVEITGPGNVVCYNTVRGYRDCLSTMEDTGTVNQVCMDFYNNDVYAGADDGIEADFCFSNCRIVRNRLTNCFVGVSSQPGLGGPTYFIRNVMYNLAYAPFKLHRYSQGDVVLHNTVVKAGDGMACFAGQPFDHAFFRNNLCIGGPPGQKVCEYGPGTGRAVCLAAHGPHCDLDYDGLGTFQTPFAGQIGRQHFASAEEMRKGPQETHGVKVDLDVFKSVAFPDKMLTEFVPPDLRPVAGTAAVDAGQRLPNINDDFSGQGADLGAYESGQELPHYGPRPAGTDEATEYAAREASAKKR